ncbi:hypothetical protein [Streptomyces sp. NPDC056291]|uniref:hypothetical protein n=1 Tax=Streptomyces sp. NPDC056291 TaxID=3345772 RepID=UPI0035DC0CC4
MSELTDRWDTVNTGLYIDQYDGSDIPRPVADLLEALVGDVEVLKEGLQNLRELMAMRLGATSEAAGMSRVDALKAAREHVEAMSTNTRGYQDGVKLSDKVSAVETFARFLMGEESE